MAGTWPKWIKNAHLLAITLFVLAGLVICIAFSVLPLFNGHVLRVTCYKKVGDCGLKPRTGFRTWLIILHFTIDMLIFVCPYLLWYWRISQEREPTEPPSNVTSLPRRESVAIAERGFYYSYAINDGPGQKIATLGISISNIMFAIIVESLSFSVSLQLLHAHVDKQILMRYQSLNPIYYHDIRVTKPESEVNFGAATLSFFLGLLSRVFASGVPTFPVKKWPRSHYTFTGLMFLVFGMSMIVEVCLVDPSIQGFGCATCYIMRRVCAALYWFSFVGVIIFSQANLSAIASIFELLALMTQELYVISYITTFRKFDAIGPFLLFHKSYVF